MAKDRMSKKDIDLAARLAIWGVVIKANHRGELHKEFDQVLSAWFHREPTAAERKEFGDAINKWMEKIYPASIL